MRGARALAAGTTIGRKRILRVPPVECDALVLRVEDALAGPAIASIEAYGAR